METRISGGSEKGRKLRSSKSAGLRPTSERVRSAIFSLIGSETFERARVLDLYAGTGALGIEALSRGANSADFVESDAMRCKDIRDSVKEFGFAEHSRIIRGSVERILGTIEGRYSLVFADPPYKTDPWDAVMQRLQAKELLEEGAVVVAEHANTYEIDDRYGRLEIWKQRRYGDTTVSIFVNGA
jgi:16S rRNA (guanine966-N2)-methyltransferase